jgi:hypothetical protein
VHSGLALSHELGMMNESLKLTVGHSIARCRYRRRDSPQLLKKILYALLVSLFFVLVLSPKVVKIDPIPSAVAETVKTPPTGIFEPLHGITAEVSAAADALFAQYGYRPPYNGQQFASGEHLTPEQAEATAPYLLVCESGNKDGNSCGIDSNGKPSCGRAQFQDWSTFWEPTSGIYGDPLNGNDAITMMLWALENGYIQRWSCAKILGVLTTN